MTRDELLLVADLAEDWLKDLPTVEMQANYGLRARADLTEPGEITPATWDEGANVVLWLRHDEDDTWKVVAATASCTDVIAEVPVRTSHVGYIEGTERTSCASCGQEGVFYADPLNISISDDGGAHDRNGDLILGGATGDVLCTMCYAARQARREAKPRQCATGCGLAAAPGDIYCEGCASATSRSAWTE